MKMTTDDEIGIGAYGTSGEGVGGILRHRIDDFIVEEISDQKVGESGQYLIVEIEKRNWDTHKLIRDLSRVLRVSRNRFGWAGTKDKRAITLQKISIWNTNKEDIDKINLKDVRFRVLGQSNKKISLGDLYSNKFQVTIRKIEHSPETTLSRIERIAEELSKNRGAPNFFGVQRFGEVRPITHLVGRALIEENPKESVMTYLTKTYPDEHPEAREAREYLAETHDFNTSTKLYPKNLTFELAMLHHLATKPDDHLGALAKLPENLQRIFIHAYQSYLFNQTLTKRIKRGIPLDTAIPGDIVCFKNSVGLPDTNRLQRVTSENLDGINRLIQRGRAFTTAPLPGYETPLATETPGEIEREVLAAEDTRLEDFKTKPAKYASKGMRREMLTNPNTTYNITQDELHTNHTKATLNFTLQKGSYATILLREYMKLSDAG
ncbi:tRNA pseudouridine(13) synthase TruD [Methanosarcinales archaeon]|nr:MAG: tRNA pseudouridine(13) synthase TruD [Methanosarcinales archaeon]